jgi:hypothetical protein
MVLNNGFFEMSQEEMMAVDGGGWLKTLSAFTGTVLIGCTPIAAFYGVGTATFTTGCGLLEYACS